MDARVSVSDTLRRLRVCVCVFKQMIKMGYFEPHTRLAVDRFLSFFFFKSRRSSRRFDRVPSSDGLSDKPSH